MHSLQRAANDKGFPQNGTMSVLTLFVPNRIPDTTWLTAPPLPEILENQQGQKVSFTKLGSLLKRYTYTKI